MGTISLLLVQDVVVFPTSNVASDNGMYSADSLHRGLTVAW